MTETENDTPPVDEAEISRKDRVFLVVVDDTPEMRIALRFACMRARNTGGRVALLYVMARNDLQYWMGVGELMREEARSHGERVLQDHAKKVLEWSESMPILFLREGTPREALLKLITEEPHISILVLGASVGGGGPGPLVSALTGKMIGKLRVPITVVPGNLTDEHIDSVA